MKGNLESKDDVKKVSSAINGSGSSYIKIDKGKNFIRLLSKEYVCEFVHTLDTGNNQYSFIPCLGKIQGKGYSPDVCPICGKAKEHWNRIKEIKANPGYDKSDKLKVQSELELKKGKGLQTNLRTVMIAVKGKAIRERTKDGIKTIPDFDGEAKYLSITTSQWTKITETIFEEYDFMKTPEDLLNRNLLFEKEEKKGRKSGKYTEVEIKPSKTKSKVPKITNDIPILDDVFTYKTEEEAKEILNNYLKAHGEEVDDDNEKIKDGIDEIDIEDKELDDLEDGLDDSNLGDEDF